MNLNIRKTGKGVYEIKTINGWLLSHLVKVGDYVYTSEGEIVQLSENDVLSLPKEIICLTHLLKRYFKYRYLRFEVLRRKYLKNNNKKPINDDQMDMIRIIRESILDPDAQLLVDSLLDVSYIYIEPSNIFVKIEYKYAYVTNSKSNYVLPIPQNEYNGIIKMYNKRKSSIMKKWENQILDKNRKSLQQIYLDLKKSQQSRRNDKIE